ncbi:Aste57867_18393 [Aphanomyces stellatus]|uniref:Aste57867_18393 protein n=1 Tax=Aphanomyces stellatus TaxID=120398 RepID=A0A485LAU5_9STRA|nr:hypothetical protein As57867_018331 [Aphanomyces stellatus]VFT95129.1 Aste57867_18393 [Aphanomyces stellatus]
MKAVYFVACVLAVACAQTNSTGNSTKPATTEPVKALCTGTDVDLIHQLESTPSYNLCRQDAQKQIYDGEPTDVCGYPSCVTAVQNLVGKYPKCNFDGNIRVQQIQPFVKACNVDPLKTTKPETTTPKPTLAKPNSTSDNDTITTDLPTTAVKTLAPVTTSKGTPAPPTTAPSSASTISAAIGASVVLALSMM